MTDDRCFYPMLVSSKQGVADSPGEVVGRWQKFRTLPEKSKIILLSEEVPFAIRNIVKNYQLSLLQAEEISRIVRNLFFGDVSLENIAKEIFQKISELGEENSRFVAETIKNKIFYAAPKKELPVENRQIVKLPLSQALKQYPKLGEQEITSAPIKLKYFSSPVRPSINNWITDYRAALGSGGHDLMDRGNYLYHSENGKKITPADRRKLTVILKSLDENALLEIDPEKQTVIFPPDTEQKAEQETGRKYNFDSMHRILEGKSQSVQNAIPRQEKNQTAKTADRRLDEALKISGATKKNPPRVELAGNNAIKFESGKPRTVPWDFRNFAPAPERFFASGEGGKENIGGTAIGAAAEKKPPVAAGETEISKVQFSSPQKLPVENKLNSGGNEIRSDKKEKQTPFHSYRISPIGNPLNGEEDSNDPKINGNTVDLSAYRN